MEYKIKNHVGASNTSCADKYLIFHVEGGLGKNIASTAVVTHLKKKYPDRRIIVVSPYPEIFLNNKYIYRVYRFGATPYFYDDYINGKDTIVFRKEPYFENDHIMRKTSLYETWFNMYDIPYEKKEICPYLPTNGMQEFLTQKWEREKPVFVIHTSGGPFDENAQSKAHSWTRDMPPNVAMQIAEAAKKDYHIIQVCRKNSYMISDVERVPTDKFLFEGFLPEKRPARLKRLSALCEERATLILYEAPHRLKATVADCIEIFGGNRKSFLGRELTKLFETVYLSTLLDLQSLVDTDSNQTRGESVLLIAGFRGKSSDLSPELSQLAEKLSEDISKKRVSVLLAEYSGLTRREIYDYLIKTSTK